MQQDFAFLILKLLNVLFQLNEAWALNHSPKLSVQKTGQFMKRQHSRSIKMRHFFNICFEGQKHLNFILGRYYRIQESPYWKLQSHPIISSEFNYLCSILFRKSFVIRQFLRLGTHILPLKRMSVKPWLLNLKLFNWWFVVLIQNYR